MARPKSKQPKYNLHRQSGRAYVAFNEKQYLLPGKYDSHESRTAYDKLVGAWLTAGRTLPTVAPSPTGPTITVVVLAFWKHAQAHYVAPDGKPTGEAGNFKHALRPLRRIYGDELADDFGPKKLKALRAAMLLPQPIIDPKTKSAKLDTSGKPVTRPGWSRSYANRQTWRLKQVFRWAASEELVDAKVAAALETVDAIQAGKEGSRESKKVMPVEGDVVERTIPHLPPPVAAMVKLQLLTCARGGELFQLTTRDIDRASQVWVFRPNRHKTAHHGASRTIFFGPKAQDVLCPFLRLDPDAPIFRPTDAIEWRNERVAASARLRPRRTRQRKTRKVSATYNKSSYARAIARACQAHGLPHWHPHQLRHTAATVYRRESDLETSRIVIGHQSADMTAHYAERDEKLAKEIVARIG